MANIHVRVKTKLITAGLTQEQVADVMGIESSRFSRILRGTRPMPEAFEKRVDAAIELVIRAEQAAIEARLRVLEGAK